MVKNVGESNGRANFYEENDDHGGHVGGENGESKRWWLFFAQCWKKNGPGDGGGLGLSKNDCMVLIKTTLKKGTTIILLFIICNCLLM